ncbi:hypothetical protein L7F22_013065 [Adiantum nelumboides]|nr:hypothetical protein [Adiantum nelumboides]
MHKWVGLIEHDIPHSQGLAYYATGFDQAGLACQEEIERQPLVWNAYVRDEQGRQLGARTHIDWARWAAGPASTFGVWAESSYVDTDIMVMDSGIRRGIAARMIELDAAIPKDWHQVLTGRRNLPIHANWWASFDQTGRPLVAQYGSLFTL